ncbi:LuxR family transcriptional regulator [Pseudomonas sp. SBB6]|uniref:helix-turn-helix transcriptional regulator n=1 Tax=Pseudomonas sp. SBB6 TaxID=2962032 RepID=UPI0020B8BEFD|nr:LuxR family transcriptional regulator [Pseudomonas sp. SBB6]MCP3751652.1 LuxR family transcriptional regulator [Pseudomonas sp. SBB6]
MLLTLESSAGQEYLSRLRAALEVELRKVGLSCYTVMFMNKQRHIEPFIFSNFPQGWLNEYRQGSYHLQDPVVLYGLRRFSPFFWEEAVNAFSNSEAPLGELIQERATNYGLTAGYALPLHDPEGHLALLNLSFDFDSGVPPKLQGDGHHRLQMALIRFYEGLLSHVKLSPEATSEALEDTPKQNVLSQREVEILRWVGMGKSYWEVAQISGVVERTVKFHMANVAFKLQVCNAKQAIYKAKALGLV